MSISFKTIDLNSSEPVLFAQTETAKPATPVMSETQIKAIISASISAAIAEANSLSAAHADAMVARVKEELEPFKKNRAQLMIVEIDQVRRKLTKTASPYLPTLLQLAGAGLNALLVGPAGSGKTVAAEQVAEALGLEFGQLCMTAGASETWLFGRQTPTGFIEAAFSKLFREGGVFLLDELDAADANLLLAINTAIANGHLFNPISGELIKRHPKFVLIAGANTVGRGGDSVYTGRNRLDGSTLTRFVKISVDYSEEIESVICPDDSIRERLQSARKKLRDLRAIEIISTRCIGQVYQQTLAGRSLEDALQSLTLGWPEELVDQTGILKDLHAEPKKTRKASAPKTEPATSAATSNQPF